MLGQDWWLAGKLHIYDYKLVYFMYVYTREVVQANIQTNSQHLSVRAQFIVFDTCVFESFWDIYIISAAFVYPQII